MKTHLQFTQFCLQKNISGWQFKENIQMATKTVHAWDGTVSWFVNGSVVKKNGKTTVTNHTNIQKEATAIKQFLKA